MVSRKLNEPTAKIGKKYPVFWLREVGSQWYCRQCSQTQAPNTTCLEVMVREAVKDAKDKTESLKLFLCMPCALTMLNESVEKVQVVKEFGAEAYKLLRKGI